MDFPRNPDWSLQLLATDDHVGHITLIREALLDLLEWSSEIPSEIIHGRFKVRGNWFTGTLHFLRRIATIVWDDRFLFEIDTIFAPIIVRLHGENIRTVKTEIDVVDILILQALEKLGTK